MSNRRICHTCGKEYEYCPRCGKYASYPKWMFNWDTEECKDIFKALTDFNIGKIKKKDLKAILDKYKVDDFSKYSESIRDELTKLFPKRARKKIVDIDLNASGEDVIL